MVACFLTLPGLRVSAENPSGINAEVNAPQNINIKGRIVDQNGQPVIGASLFQQGTNNGTVADVEVDSQSTCRMARLSRYLVLVIRMSLSLPRTG